MSARQHAREARARWRRVRLTTSQAWVKRKLAGQGHDVSRAVWVDSTAAFATPVSLERGSRINYGVTIKGGGRVTVGAYCDVSAGTTIITSNHRTETPSMEYDLARKFGWELPKGPELPTSIGAASWIGERCLILPGVQIGEGALCAAAAVVTRDVEPFTIVAGIPARVVGHRFSSDVVDVLLDVRWWDWSEQRIGRNRSFFGADLTRLTAAEVRAIIRD